MPDDDGAGAPTLSDRARDALVSAFARAASAKDGAPQIRDALRTVAREARDRSIAPATLLEVLRQTWRTAAPSRGVDELIALSLREYLGSDGEDGKR
jgi:hypothetical protein